ncbi:conserved hypothetical protein [Gammaproteobacteria bacterium]
MPIRLAIHVGPHKTGSTSVQRALAAARETLAGQGVWYPPSLPGAAWPKQHADAWLLLRDERWDDFDAWLASCREEAARRGCDTLFLSSENFQVPRTRPALKRLLARWRRRTGGDTRLLYVRRDLVDLACSRALSHLAGEAGFYFLHNYDLRRWAGHFAVEQIRHERWFRRHGTRFIPLADGPRDGLAARLLDAAADRPFPGIITGDDNITAVRLANARVILSYGLRVMHHYATGEAVNVPAAFVATRRIFGTPHLDEKAFAALTEGFNAGVKREVKEGIDDFRRLSPLARQWRVWFEKSDSHLWR